MGTPNPAEWSATVLGRKEVKVVMQAGQCVVVETGVENFSLGSIFFFSKVDREMISREQEERQ